jgi:phosphoglycerate dehydrogenase-like enzyme
VGIAVPLEAEHVEAIRAVDPSITVLYEPDLLPPERFPADHSGDPSFRRSADAEERYWKLVNSADVLYGFPNESPAGFARVVAENPRLRWVHAMAAGAGGAVKASGVSREDLERVIVTTSAGVHALPLAEFAVMGILNGLKRTAELAEDQRAKNWPDLGEIGVETARLARALGMTVSGTKRTADPIDGIEEVATAERLPELLARADALVNTLPGTPFTDKLIGREVFSAMRSGTILVNVGRGTVVDEDALLEALENGSVGYACLDVFAVEPLPETSPLWEHPRVLVSPHTSALSAAENRLIAERFADNLRKFQAGEPLPHRVDPVHFY